MAEKTDSITHPPPESVVNDQGPKPDLFARLSAIERVAPPPRERAWAFLEAVVDSLGCLGGAVTVASGGEEQETRLLGENKGLSAWNATLDDAALEARTHAKSVARLYGKGQDGPEYAIVACPIDAAGRDPFGGIAVLIRCREIPDAERVQLHLRSACLHAAGMLARPAAVRRSRVEMDEIARVYNRAGRFKDLAEFAFAITNAARQRFNCDQAAMGTVRRGRVRLLCISGLDSIKKRSPGVHRIEQAMGECADLANPVVGQPRDTWDQSAFAEEGKLHLRWRAATDNACVLSVPVTAGDEVVAVLSFRRGADQPFDADDVEAVQKLLAPLGGAIPLVERSTLSLRGHTARSLRESMAWLLYKGSLRKRAALAVGVGLLAWAAASSSTYHINTRAAVVAERERVVAAPTEGLVAQVLVRAGDHVNSGDLLLRMDTARLALEASQIEAEIAATEIRLQSAIAGDDPAAASVARAERRAQRVRLASVRRRIDEALVRAPVSGVVVGPELAEAPGRLVAAGHPLLSIAESGSLALELRVPEGRVADLEPGAPVRFASHARPETPGHTAIERVAPAAVRRDNEQVFVAEATLPADLDWLRPGMEGVAIIDAGERPNWWIATHGLIDAARLRFWID